MREGMRITFVAIDSEGTGYYRARLPAAALEKAGHEVKVVDYFVCPESAPPEVTEWPEVVAFSRQFDEKTLLLQKRLQDSGIKVVYDTDDILEYIHTGHPAYPFWNHVEPFPSDTHKRMTGLAVHREFLKRADAVTVSTKFIRNYYKRMNPNIYVCENGIDPALVMENSPVSKTPITIGYSGGGSHARDLIFAVGALRAIRNKYRGHVDVLFMGSAPSYVTEVIPDARMAFSCRECHGVITMPLHEAKKKAVNNVPWDTCSLCGCYTYFESKIPPMNFLAKMGEQGIDIGIAPLDRSRLNIGKSSIKYYEYSAIGALTVATKLEPYERIKGVLVNHHDSYDAMKYKYEHGKDIVQASWFHALDGILSKGIDYGILASAREDVKARHTMATKYKAWENVFKEIVNEKAIKAKAV
jgi:hypothetical protein